MKNVLFIGVFAGALWLTLFLAGRALVPHPLGQSPSPAFSPVARTNATPSVPSVAAPAMVAANSVSVSGPTNSIPAPSPTAFAAFAGWVERRLAGDPTADAARGEALAWQRRAAMLELIEINPAQALALAVPFGWRRTLPANITRHFEQWVDARGAFEVAMAESVTSGEEIVYRWAVVDGKRYQAFVYGRRLGQKSQQNVPLHGLALAGKIALTPEAIRFIDADEAGALEHARGHVAGKVCAVCGQAAKVAGQGKIAEIGGETRLFCSEEHAQLVNRNLMVAASGGSGPVLNAVAGGGTSWTAGRKDVLYMRVNFPDDLTEPNSETAAYSAMNSVNQFYVDNAYDQVWLSTTVTPLLTLPQVKAWYATAGPFALLSDAREVARKAGFDTDNYQLDIVSHTSVPGFDWCGLGFVGAKGTWLQCSGAGVTAHELGHNFGVIHANLWNPDADYTSIHGLGVNVEYGNIYDTMGAAAAGNNQFNAVFKHDLDWLPATQIHTVTTNGVYRLHALDAALRTSGRFYAATVRKDFERDYWLEFRNRFTGNASLQNGVLLDWAPWSQSGGAELLDATPATATLNDAAVVIGRTFSDALAGIHITPLARGATGTDPWLDVRINLATGTPNMPCCLKVEVEPANAAPGQLVRFHATVADRDDNSFAYAWSFDDGTFSTNNQPWAYKSWTTTGEHVVRCEVSDMRGGRASANAIATVGAGFGFRVSGVVLDANGHALEDVFIRSTFTNANNVPVTGFTDSDGAFVLAGVTGQFDVTAAKYGHAFDSVGWVNPLTVTADLATADFHARALTNVTLILSTNRVIENVASTNQFILTRSGDGSNDLTVDLYLSGSATAPGDLVITPPLLPGANSVVIPAGTNRLVFTFSPVNDGTVEGTEVAYVSIRDSAAYVITPLAEGRITLLDDDLAALPAVAVAALDGPVLENGMNNAGFLVPRTGSTTGALPVNFSTGGTATAGADYATLLGTVIIPAGSASAVVQLEVRDDKDVEPNETVSVSLSASPTYAISGSSAAVTILDDDVLVVTVSPTQSGLAEPGASGRFTVKRDGDQTANLVVNYTLTGSASNGVDYVSPSGTVTIPAGVAATDVVITALNDALVEGDESVTLVLSTNAAYDIGTPGSATLTLFDDEKVTVTVAAQDATASEPGSDFGTFTLARGPVTSGDLTVNLALNGTAIAGSDYLPLENSVVIPDGSSSVSLTVIPFDDLHWEETETVIVTLVASTNYNLGTPRQATVNLLDDETSGPPAVGFCFNTFAALESESPGLAVALSRTSSAPVTVQYQVIGGTASGADYALAPGTLTFDPGEWAKSIPLPVVNDTLVEADETIRVTLFNPMGATHDGIKVITYTIKDDDVSSVSVGATVPTADEVGPVAGNFRITRTGGTNASLLVNYQITGTASAPSDFASLGTSVTIPAGITFMDLPVIPVDDATVELDEEVTLTLISAPGGKIVAPGAATITILDANTNGLPVVTLTSTNQPNAVEGGTNGAFVLTRTGTTNSALTVYLGTAGTATSGADYAALSPSVVIPAGQLSVTLPVTPVNDALIEGEETVLASVTARETYRVAFPGTAQVMIQDNDQSVRIDASDFEAAEPGTNAGEFTFTRFGTTNTAVQIFYTVNGSAGNGTDYAAISNSIIIPAGSLTATLPITPLDDALIEGAELVTLTLSANAAYTLGAVTAATVTILDDEPMVSVVASRTNIFEGSQTPVVLTVRRGGNTAYEFTAHLAVGGSAGYGVDYPAFATNVFFNCGVAAIDLLIFPTNELVTEVSETISATVLSDAAYSRLAPSNAVIAITDAGTNLAPVVAITSPTTNRVYLLPTRVNMILEATVADDGETNAPPVTVTWTNLSGPGTLVFGTPNLTNTTVSFTEGGEYVLRLTADDGQVSGYAEVTVMVGAFARLTNNPARSELLHWTFDEGSGTNVFDVSGNTRHGAVQGVANWATNGIAGGALNLSGTNNFVRATSDPGFLNGRESFSLACWVKAAISPATRGLFAADDTGLPTLTLATRTAASCGASSNVIEGTLATSCEEGRQVSAANVLTNGWQHLAVIWSNNLAPALYLNGELDQPGKHQSPLRGVLANCPHFLLGKGPPDLTNTFAGLVDEVRVFPWAMDAAEVGTFVAANFGAIVAVPTNITVQILTPVDLTGVVTDDDRPVPPGTVTVTWSEVSGPVPVPIPNPNALTNTVSFTNAGDYVFRLIADDGQVKIYDDLPVTVVEPTQVSVTASDADAAELGPDTGEFTFTRVGDLAVALTVNFAMSGTASNGADFVQILPTNSVTFPIGSNTVIIPITPFLDHRTEGDETIMLTVLSNLIYSISSGMATVTIHDSPYGQWNVALFTLEQLTDPTLSGEVADFDHDGLVNFAEYAVNRDPKVQETNSPLRTTLEVNPGDSLNHITLTYTRRIAPTDAAYEVALSTNLLTWQTGTNVVQEISTMPDGNNLTETVKAQLVAPWPTGVRQFVTVRVWLLSTGP